MKSPYHVWRRNDGYVGATCYQPQGWRTADEIVFFETLLVTSDWDKARTLIERERSTASEN